MLLNEKVKRERCWYMLCYFPQHVPIRLFLTTFRKAEFSTCLSRGRNSARAFVVVQSEIFKRLYVANFRHLMCDFAGHGMVWIYHILYVRRTCKRNRLVGWKYLYATRFLSWLLRSRLAWKNLLDVLALLHNFFILFQILLVCTVVSFNGNLVRGPWIVDQGPSWQEASMNKLFALTVSLKNCPPQTHLEIACFTVEIQLLYCDLRIVFLFRFVIGFTAHQHHNFVFLSLE